MGADEHEENCAGYHRAGADLPAYRVVVLQARIAGAFGAMAAVRTRLAAVLRALATDAGARRKLPAEYPERAACMPSPARVEVDGRRFEAGHVLPPGGAILFTAQQPSTGDARRRSGGRTFHRLNFLLASPEGNGSNRRAADWKAGRMKTPDLDNKGVHPAAR